MPMHQRTHRISWNQWIPLTVFQIVSLHHLGPFIVFHISSSMSSPSPKKKEKNCRMKEIHPQINSKPTTLFLYWQSKTYQIKLPPCAEMDTTTTVFLDLTPSLLMWEPSEVENPYPQWFFGFKGIHFTSSFWLGKCFDLDFLTFLPDFQVLHSNWTTPFSREGFC